MEFLSLSRFISYSLRMLCVLAAFISNAASANVDVSGTWDVNSVYTLANCSDTTYDSRTYNSTSTPTLNQQADGSISGAVGQETFNMGNDLGIVDDGGILRTGTYTETDTSDDINLQIDAAGNLTDPGDARTNGTATNTTLIVHTYDNALKTFVIISTDTQIQCKANATHNGTKQTSSSDSTETTNTTEQPSTTVINTPSTLQSTITATTTFINTRISNILKGSLGGGLKLFKTGGMFDATFGRAAGEELEGIGVWGSYSNMSFKNTGSGTEYDGGRHNVMFGTDIQPIDNTVLGIALGYELTDIVTSFNDGALDSQGFTLTPYLGIAINENWSLDALFGYGSLDIDQFRISSGTRITSDTEAERWFVSSNLTYGTLILNNFYVEGSGGLLRAIEAQKSYTESNNDEQARVFTGLSQLQLSSKITYLGFTDVQPYFGVTYNRDTSTSSGATLTNSSGNTISYSDKDDYLLNTGLRYQKSDTVSAGVDITHRVARDNNEESTISLDMRVIF